MKTRLSFVSNSSSCSFCIVTKAKNDTEFLESLDVNLKKLSYYTDHSVENVKRNLLHVGTGLKKVFDNVSIIFGTTGTEGQDDCSIYLGAVSSKDKTITQIFTY